MRTMEHSDTAHSVTVFVCLNVQSAQEREEKSKSRGCEWINASRSSTGKKDFTNYIWICWSQCWHCTFGNKQINVWALRIIQYVKCIVKLWQFSDVSWVGGPLYVAHDRGAITQWKERGHMWPGSPRNVFLVIRCQDTFRTHWCC